MEGDRFSVRKVRHRDGSQSYWIFTPDLEVHRSSLNVLKRYGTSTQQTYAYSLVDHLNWLLANGKTPDVVTFDDLQRYMNGVTGQVDGVYGAVWRKPTQKPIGPSAAGNVASVVKAYYLALAASGGERGVGRGAAVQYRRATKQVWADGPGQSAGTEDGLSAAPIPARRGCASSV